MKKSKEDVASELRQLADHCDMVGFGENPETKDIIDRLEQKWEPAQTYSEWRRGVEALLYDAIRLSASMGSWIRLDGKAIQSATSAGFIKIMERMADSIISKVNESHAEATDEDKGRMT